MKVLRGLYVIVGLSVILSTSTIAFGTSITFSVDPPLIGPLLSQDINLFSSAMNGTVLQGQPFSLDLIFANGILARVFESHLLSVVLIVQTDAGTPPGFAGSSSGFLL